MLSCDIKSVISLVTCCVMLCRFISFLISYDDLLLKLLFVRTKLVQNKQLKHVTCGFGKLQWPFFTLWHCIDSNSNQFIKK